mmetsp:Transcript_46259/g.116382  ORF Transcript_46259/g.116382 Transcript_46259/m.116382 type:complete len:205 (+) Transcript_46259:278-892(+)
MSSVTSSRPWAARRPCRPRRPRCRRAPAGCRRARRVDCLGWISTRAARGSGGRAAFGGYDLKMRVALGSASWTSLVCAMEGRLSGWPRTSRGHGESSGGRSCSTRAPHRAQCSLSSTAWSAFGMRGMATTRTSSGRPSLRPRGRSCRRRTRPGPGGAAAPQRSTRPCCPKARPGCCVSVLVGCSEACRPWESPGKPDGGRSSCH